MIISSSLIDGHHRVLLFTVVSQKSEAQDICLARTMCRVRRVCVFQAVCEWGRESVESWGRRKRSVAANTTDSEDTEDDMTLSQEILVLDFGDEKQSQFLKSNEALYSEFDKGMCQCVPRSI